MGFLSFFTLGILFYCIAKADGKGRLPKNGTKMYDPSCKHPSTNPIYPSPYEFGYNETEIKETGLFRKKNRFESYVGYPCNLKLYKEFKTKFLLPGLSCPFIGDLEKSFQDWVWSTLRETQQEIAIKSNNTPSETSLFFQYICFSDQFEECVKNSAYVSGTCDGICKCMKSVPIRGGYPKGLNAKQNAPVIEAEVENDIRCSVKANGLCIPKWASNCNKGSKGYNATMAKTYEIEDFFFKCGRTAACSENTGKCECADGWDCGRGSRVRKHLSTKLVFFLNFLIFLFWNREIL